MSEKICNGYRHICDFKGKPIVELDFTLSFSKKPNIGFFCIDCCRHYLKCHPDLEQEQPDDKRFIEEAISKICKSPSSAQKVSLEKKPCKRKRTGGA